MATDNDGRVRDHSTLTMTLAALAILGFGSAAFFNVRLHNTENAYSESVANLERQRDALLTQLAHRDVVPDGLMLLAGGAATAPAMGESLVSVNSGAAWSREQPRMASLRGGLEPIIPRRERPDVETLLVRHDDSRDDGLVEALIPRRQRNDEAPGLLSSACPQ